ncbi:NRDE family protein [Flavobacterium chuncheonense]|uniref:NRDE family protein n=1 Tax=Flavobacterium chuncheonense TaxID=2026653 RepID=A0ABW5YI53_9FLAO
MCTVSFIKTDTGFCITSNRDEKITREKAIPPKAYLYQEKQITYPKDPKAGGTWFAHDSKNVMVLLNGANEKHVPKPSYRKSRGIILLDLIASVQPLEEWKKIDLNEIEPFTIVFFSGEQLFELQWDEKEKRITKLDINLPHIWSSATLYNQAIRIERKKWFNEFIENHAILSPQNLLAFHQFTESSNKDFGLQINRNNLLKTISITQTVIQNDSISIQYIDLYDS